MPTSKKPRKVHRPIKIRLPGAHYSDAMVTELKSIVNRTALIIEITLPRGDATDDHMHCIQDFLNWGGIVVYLRRLKGQEEAKQEFFERFQEALHALNDILNRKNAADFGTDISQNIQLMGCSHVMICGLFRIFTIENVI